MRNRRKRVKSRMCFRVHLLLKAKRLEESQWKSSRSWTSTRGWWKTGCCLCGWRKRISETSVSSLKSKISTTLRTWSGWCLTSQWSMVNYSNICDNYFKEVLKTHLIDATPAFIRDDYRYLKKTKKTLLMFRRIAHPDLGNKLELRH